jgi:hypothetical protein
MPWEIKILRNEDIINIVCSGNIDYEQILQMSSEGINAEKKHGINKYLVDDRDITPDLSISEISKLPKAFKEQGLEPWNKVAIIFSSKSTKKEEFSYFETASFNYGFLIRLFSDEKQALEWLKQ